MDPESKCRRPKPKITVSKETTYITSPLRDDGYIDYVAAINERCSRGVTPENNAAVPFWQAAGPKALDPRIRMRYFELLGIPELPDQGDYLLDFDDFVLLQLGTGCDFAAQAGAVGGRIADVELRVKQAEERIKEAQSRVEESKLQLDRAMEGPWSRKDFPLAAAFLDRNSRPLQVLTDGLRRPRFYAPVVLASANLSLMTTTGAARSAGKQFRARAMLRLNDGDLAGAWNDVLAAYRLARLSTQGPFIVDQLIAFTLEGIAAFAAIAVSMNEGVSAAMARACQDDLRSLPTPPSFRTVMNEGERLFQLNAVADTAISGPNPYSKPEGMDQFAWELLESLDPDRKRREEAWERLDTAEVDWSEVLRQFNLWHDQLVAALDRAEWTERVREITSLQELAIAQVRQAIDLILSTEPSQIKEMSPQTRDQCVTRLLAGPGLGGGVNHSFVIFEQRRQVYVDLVNLAFALAGYRHDHGRYPKRLSRLCPEYIDQVPADAFSGGKLHYKSDGDGYLLYSVGPNLQDDGGRNFIRDREDWSDWESASEEEKAADDIAIRTPAKGDG